LENNQKIIKSLKTGIEDIEITDTDSEQKDAISIIVGDIKIYLLGAIDKEKEKIRIQKEIENIEKFVKMTEGKLNNASFVEKAPQEVVERERLNLQTKKEELKVLHNQLKNI